MANNNEGHNEDERIRLGDVVRPSGGGGGRLPLVLSIISLVLVVGLGGGVLLGAGVGAPAATPTLSAEEQSAVASAEAAEATRVAGDLIAAAVQALAATETASAAQATPTPTTTPTFTPTATETPTVTPTATPTATTADLGQPETATEAATPTATTADPGQPETATEAATPTATTADLGQLETATEAATPTATQAGFVGVTDATDATEEAAAEPAATEEVTEEATEEPAAADAAFPISLEPQEPFYYGDRTGALVTARWDVTVDQLPTDPVTISTRYGRLLAAPAAGETADCGATNDENRRLEITFDQVSVTASFIYCPLSLMEIALEPDANTFTFSVAGSTLGTTEAPLEADSVTVDWRLVETLPAEAFSCATQPDAQFPAVRAAAQPQLDMLDAAEFNLDLIVPYEVTLRSETRAAEDVGGAYPVTLAWTNGNGVVVRAFAPACDAWEMFNQGTAEVTLGLGQTALLFFVPTQAAVDANTLPDLAVGLNFNPDAPVTQLETPPLVFALGQQPSVFSTTDLTGNPAPLTFFRDGEFGSAIARRETADSIVWIRVLAEGGEAYNDIEADAVWVPQSTLNEGQVVFYGDMTTLPEPTE